MEKAIQVLAVIHFTVVGLSHLIQPRPWADFFIRLREEGTTGVFVVAFMSLWFGSIVVAFHNVWTGIPMALTIVGWAQVLKGLIYFCFPEFGLRRISYVERDRAHLYSVAGVVLLILAGLLGYELLKTSGFFLQRT
jgi:hypothetical protein